jgi:hypothetical protein
MGHDSNVVKLGTTQSSFKVVDNHIGAIPAGKVVRLKSDDTLSNAKSDGNILGVSIGRSQSDTSRTSIVRKGTRVPLLLTSNFSPAVGGAVCIDDTTGLGKATGGGVTTTNGVYATAKLDSYDEDGTLTADNVAYIDFPGGL